MLVVFLIGAAYLGTIAHLFLAGAPAITFVIATGTMIIMMAVVGLTDMAGIGRP